jgi:hypothetical protein
MRSRQRRISAAERAAQTLRRSLAALLFLCFVSAGCDRTCVGFFSNLSGGVISVNGSPCPLNTKTSGMVRVRLSASPAIRTMWTTTGVQHILLSLQGIEAHPSPLGDEAPKDWVELAPSLAKQPLEVDLMDDNEDPSPSILVGQAAIASAGYAEVRLLLVPDRLATGVPNPERSACIGVGSNCVVTADGSVRPLILGGGESELLIPSTRITGGMFYVLADTRTNLDLEFSSDSSMAFVPGRAIWLNPVFNVHSEFSSDSREESEQSSATSLAPLNLPNTRH